MIDMISLKNTVINNEVHPMSTTKDSSEQAKNFDAEALKEEINEGEVESPNSDNSFDTDYEIAKANSESLLEPKEESESKPKQEVKNFVAEKENKSVDIPQEFVEMAKSIEDN